MIEDIEGLQQKKYREFEQREYREFEEKIPRINFEKISGLKEESEDLSEGDIEVSEE